MSTAVVTAFISELRKAQVLESAQQEEAERLAEKATRPAELAGELLRKGWLTTYQANQIARGRGSELVHGSYLILEPLAKGGMGQVFKARHRLMHRLVALKFIRPDQRDSADTVHRFRREVRLLAELRHPHIVQAYDAGNVGDVWFLAMELLQGVTLDQLVHKNGPLPVEQACAYIRQAALGLHHAHERGLVHRDIKPSNLFLTGEGLKLLDLGLARPQALEEGTQPGDLTRANTVMGTPDYLAPEQALDPRRADARSDLYSLGCTLFFLLTGQPPFPDGTLAQKLLYHQQAAPPLVGALRPDVPRALGELLHGLLAKSPAQRPASAGELASRLEPFAGTVPAELPLTRASTEISPPTPLPNGRSATGVAPSSLINEKATPERGFTLLADSLPPTSPSSLIDSRAAAPERGFTLAAESMPPTSASALMDSRANGPERGFTLRTESLPPTPAPAPPPVAPIEWEPEDATLIEEPSPWETLRTFLARREALIGVCVAGVGLLLVLIFGTMTLVGLFSPPREGTVAAIQASSGEQGKTEKRVVPNPVGAPPSKLFPSGPRRYLSDLEEFFVQAGEWPLGKNGILNLNKLILVQGKLSPKGLSMHPPRAPAYTAAKYHLYREAAVFKATVAVDDTTNFCWTPAIFTVFGDGKELWQSTKIAHNHQRTQPCQVDVTGVDVLELRVHCLGHNLNVYAVWVEPRLLQKADTQDK